MAKKAFYISEETIARIVRCQKLLAAQLGVGSLSQGNVIEVAIQELYRNHQWREDENADDN